MRKIEHYISGKRVAGKSGNYADVTNPATGEVIAATPLASADEVRDVIAAANAALPAWAATPPAKRAEVLFNFRDLLKSHAGELAPMLSEEHGKTNPDALGEVARGLEVVEFACGIPHLLKGEYSEAVSTGVDSYTLRKPVGVCAGITPFNFPAMVPMWMYPVAIACGNAFILKPSEKDPSASMMLAEWLKEAGLPDGVFSVVHGDKEAVDAILTHPDIAAVSFVGSTPIAEYVYQTGCCPR